MLTILRCPDAVAPETRTVTGVEFAVGRGPDVDWVLPDPERLLSKRHFALAFRAGSWQITDTSSNGTFLNGETNPIGTGSLRHGDRLRLGGYEIEVRLVAGMGARPGVGSRGDPFGDPFAVDPFAPARPEGNPFDEPDHPGPRIEPIPAQLPDDFDPLAPELGETTFRGPTPSDHSPAMEDAFRPPAQPLQSPAVIPGDDLLPDDWDKDLLEGIAPVGNLPGQEPSQARNRTTDARPGKPSSVRLAGQGPAGPPKGPVRPAAGGGPDNHRRRVPPHTVTQTSDSPASLEAYLERLLKLIPAEVVSIYPVGRSLIANDAQEGWWTVVCLVVCVIFRLKMTRGPDGHPQWAAIAIAAVSFTIWVYVLGAHVLGLALPSDYKVWPALVLLAWTTVIPVLYTGKAITAVSKH